MQATYLSDAIQGNIDPFSYCRKSGYFRLIVRYYVGFQFDTFLRDLNGSFCYKREE